MSEKRVLEDHVGQGILHLRQQHGYSKGFRMAAGAYHTLQALAFGAGGGLLITGRDALIGHLQASGAGIRASNSAGQGALLIGGLLLFIAFVNGWAALRFFSEQQQGYWFAIVVNAVTVAWYILLSPPGQPLHWVQLAGAFMIARLLLADPRIKAFYGRGSLVEQWWDEELRRRKIRNSPFGRHWVCLTSVSRGATCVAIHK